MKVVTKTIQQDIDEQIEKLKREGKTITHIEMSKAELDQMLEEFCPKVEGKYKAMNTATAFSFMDREYRGYKIKIVEPKKIFKCDGNSVQCHCGAMMEEQSLMLLSFPPKKQFNCPKCKEVYYAQQTLFTGGDKVIKGLGLSPITKQVFMDSLIDEFSGQIDGDKLKAEVEEREAKLGNIGPFDVYVDPCLPKDEKLSEEDKLRIENKVFFNLLLERKQQREKLQGQNKIMRDTLESIQSLTKYETGSVAIQCNQWSTSALDQVKP